MPSKSNARRTRANLPDRYVEKNDQMRLPGLESVPCGVGGRRVRMAVEAMERVEPAARAAVTENILLYTDYRRRNASA